MDQGLVQEILTFLMTQLVNISLLADTHCQVLMLKYASKMKGPFRVIVKIPPHVMGNIAVVHL